MKIRTNSEDSKSLLLEDGTIIHLEMNNSTVKAFQNNGMSLEDEGIFNSFEEAIKYHQD